MIIATYILTSILIMVLKMHIDGDAFFSRQLEKTKKEREILMVKLKSKQISPLKYKQQLQGLTDKGTIRLTIISNIVASLVLAPFVVMGWLLSILADMLEIVKYWRL